MGRTKFFVVSGSTLLSASMLLLAGCGGGGSGAPLAPIHGSTSQGSQTPTLIGPSSASTSVGSTTSISVISSSGGALTATSSNPTVATIAPNGPNSFIVTGHAPGNVTITISDGVAPPLTVPVVVGAQALVLTPSTLSLTGVGDAQTFTASELGYGGTYSIVGSTVPGIATVTQTSPGTFTATAVAAGQTVVSIADALGQQATITITVTISTVTVQ